MGCVLCTEYAGREWMVPSSGAVCRCDRGEPCPGQKRSPIKRDVFKKTERDGCVPSFRRFLISPRTFVGGFYVGAIPGLSGGSAVWGSRPVWRSEPWRQLPQGPATGGNGRRVLCFRQGVREHLYPQDGAFGEDKVNFLFKSNILTSYFSILPLTSDRFANIIKKKRRYFSIRLHSS